jgi:DNA-binding NarL/FixJ family response regulator
VPATTLASCQIDAEDSLRIARDIGWRAGEVYALIQLGAVLTARGALGQALETLHAALSVAESIEHRQWIALAHGYLGYLYGVMLCPSDAREHSELSLGLARQVRSVILEGLSRAVLVLVLIQQDALTEASFLLKEGPADEMSVDTVRLTSTLARLALAEIALRQDDPDTARRHVEHLIACLPNAASDRAPLWPAIVRGEALTQLRRWDEAEAALRAAVRDAVHHGALPLLARAHLSLATLYRAHGRGLAAEQARAGARAVIERLGDSIPDQRLRDRFCRQMEEPGLPGGSAASAPATPRPFGLSTREVEVLRLVAEGLTDAEVAERLHVSRRTVTSHLTSVYNKLGVSTRTAAARVAAEHALV